MGRSKNKNKNKKCKIVKAEKRSTRVRIILTIFLAATRTALWLHACMHSIQMSRTMTEPPQKIHLQPLKHFQVLLLSIRTPGFAQFCSFSPLYTHSQCARHKNETRLFFAWIKYLDRTLLQTTRAIELGAGDLWMGGCNLNCGDMYTCTVDL